MGCVKGWGTLGIDNISLMQGCVNRGSVMDPPPLTDDGYCGLKVVTKGEKGSELCRGGMVCSVVIDLAHRS